MTTDSPEPRLYKWVMGVYQGFEVTGCMLLQSPYAGVVVEFGDRVDIFDHGLEFQWRILENPDAVNDLTSENIEFTKYLERVVLDRLDEAEGNADELERKSTESSGTD